VSRSSGQEEGERTKEGEQQQREERDCEIALLQQRHYRDQVRGVHLGI
jgi:hypothetical protein